MDPVQPAASTEHYALALNAPTGANVLAKLAAFLGKADATPLDGAQNVRAAAAWARTERRVRELRCAQIASVFEPLLAPTLVVRLGLGVAPEYVMHDPLVLVQQQWWQRHLLLRLAEGVSRGFGPADAGRPAMRPRPDPTRTAPRHGGSTTGTR